MMEDCASRLLSRLTFPNGNPQESNIADLYLDTPIPKTLGESGSLSMNFEQIRNYKPDAKDAVTSPDQTWMAVLTPSELEIYGHCDADRLLFFPTLSIPVDDNEFITSVPWLDLPKTEQLLNQLKDYTTYLPIDISVEQTQTEG